MMRNGSEFNILFITNDYVLNTGSLTIRTNEDDCFE